MFLISNFHSSIREIRENLFTQNIANLGDPRKLSPTKFNGKSTGIRENKGPRKFITAKIYTFKVVEGPLGELQLTIFSLFGLI